MSTKTLRKRIALVAVSALGFGLLSAAPSSAADTTLTGAVTVAPVRVTYTAGVQDTVSASAVTWSDKSTFAVADLVDGEDATLTVVLTQAPTAAAVLNITAGAAWGAATDASAQLGDNGEWVEAVDKTTPAGPATVALATADLGFGATVAGTYKGTITIDGDNDSDTNVLTASFSFTTTGAPASIGISKTSVEFAAVNTLTGTNTITLKDSAGNLTQSSTVDTLAVTTTSATNIALTTGATLDDSALKDGTVTYTFTSNGTADSETITVTPRGTLPGLSVAAVTFTVVTKAYGVETAVKTALSSPTSSTVVAAGTAGGSETAYKVDPSVSTLVFTVSGYVAGSAYKILVDNTNVDTISVKDDTSNTTASAAGAGDVTLNGIVGASGSVVVTVVMTGVSTTDTIGINADNGDADSADATDAKVTFATAAYAVAITSPAVTPSLQTSASAITVSGTLKDQYGSVLSGASVVVTAVTDDTADTNPSATGFTDASGIWSVTLPAVSAATTSATIGVDGTKTGATITDITAGGAGSVTVNFNATGVPSAMTFATSTGDETGATGNTPTTYPAIWVLYEGAHAGAGDVTDETYTIADGTNSTLTAGADFYTAVTPTTTPGSQVVVTGTAGLKFSTSNAAAALSALKDTVTVASGSAVYVFATTVGTHTVTLTSGSLVKTAKVVALGNEDGARNIAASSSTLTLKPSAFGTVTIAVTDAFGNAVKEGTSVALAFKATGGATLEGPALAKSTTTTDADGNVVVGVIAGGTGGTATITVTASGDQFGAAAGSLTTTAGTNGLSASVKTATIAVTIEGAPAKSAELLAIEAIAAKAAADKAESDAKIAALEAQIAANKATTDAAIAAAQAAAVAAAEAAADAAAEAIDAGNNAFDAATSAGEAADAATAAAEQAGEDATAAANAAGEAAVAAAEAATEAAAEATDAANAATDAANASAEAADAATAAAQDAADAVAALSTQVSEMISALKKQITALTNLVIKIQKKVKA